MKKCVDEPNNHFILLAPPKFEKINAAKLNLRFTHFEIEWNFRTKKFTDLNGEWWVNHPFEE